MMMRPDFFDSPYFEITDDGWRIKEGAPKEVQKEFDEYMRQRKKDERDGILA